MFSKESRSEKLERLTSEFLDNYGDEGLEEIIDNLKTPWNLGYSEELVNKDAKVTLPVVDGPSFHNVMKKVYAKDYKDFLLYAYGVRLRRIANNTLPYDVSGWGAIISLFVDLTRGWPFTKISYDEFRSLYILLEQLYFVQAGHKLGAEDLLNIYFGGLDERLVFFLDDFSLVEDENIPEPSKKYFQALKHVKYQDKNVKNMKRDLLYLIQIAIIDVMGRKGGWELDVIKTLTYCSAVSNGRNIIIRDDVVRAFNAYFRLLRTDITKYTARSDVFYETNYDNLRAKLTYYQLRVSHGTNP